MKRPISSRTGSASNPSSQTTSMDNMNILSNNNASTPAASAASAASRNKTAEKKASLTITKKRMSSQSIIYANAIGYILSGCFQPILMTVCKDAGLGHPVAQVYMFFYSFGPALVIIPLLWKGVEKWPVRWTPMYKAAGIALFDVVATCINYVGASHAGPTIFAIVYSSVTIWTAIYSRWILNRVLNRSQWMAILLVFCGLGLTATESLQLGPSVLKGLIMVTFGSAMHAFTYVGSEIVMNFGPNESLTVSQNCAIQSAVGCFVFLIWQLVYTLPNYNGVLGQPMQQAGTTPWMALFILSCFGFANLVHSLTFFYTLSHFPGGATSAGVMKGLQAVLVFGVTHLCFCGKTGGDEMCFSSSKWLSLITVCGGVFAYGRATQQEHNGTKVSGNKQVGSNHIRRRSLKHKGSDTYEPANGVDQVGLGTA
ncbi:unnamed protein product [Cylindrotheca closterium]|uniref:EamA domain-containing protein n=1 Tax=Cylindrotheca closterium TaxID=2856 RepID=A0AAD2CMT5_9STRA|nr:unnamed protein product [Cylindrotheca closterium]